MKRLSVAAAVVFACGTFLLGGCSVVGKVVNKGGDTTCKEFNGEDDEQRSAAVAKMLKDRHGKDPSDLAITATRDATAAYCKILGKDGSKISEMSLGVP